MADIGRITDPARREIGAHLFADICRICRRQEVPKVGVDEPGPNGVHPDGPEFECQLARQRLYRGKR